MGARSWLTLALLTVMFGCLAIPTIASADRADCEQREQILREAVAENPSITTAEKEAYVREGTAECWEEVHFQEAADAKDEAAIHEAKEREAAKAAVRAEEEHERYAEARAAERRKAREWRRQRHEWAHKPTVTEPIARGFARRLMRQTEFSIWTVDCHGGKIDRTHWSCSVHIFYHCLRGRIRVTGSGHKNGRAWYRAKGSELRPCRV
jgi:hypothetical protein